MTETMQVDAPPSDHASPSDVARACYSGPPLEFLAKIRAQEEGRRRPAHIDDWRRDIELQTRSALSALTCDHNRYPGGSEDRNNNGHTYVIQADGGGLVKIGRTKTGAARLSDIQAMSPVKLSVVAITRGPELERQWHIQFYKQRAHAEWFAPEVADYFRALGPGCVRCALYGDATRKVRP